MSGYGLTRSGRCKQCGKLQVRFTTDGRGHAIEVVSPCPCPKVAPPKSAREPKRAWAIAVDAERRRAGICQRCDEPVVGKPKVALYCEAHRVEARAEVERRHREKVGDKHERTYRERHAEELRQRARESYQNDPEVRARRNAYKRAWRKLNRDKVRAQKERSYRRRKIQFADYLEQYQADVAARIRKPQRRRNKYGERLCVSPYCRQVMKGRAKKCVHCKAREIREARAVLGQTTRRAA